MLGGFGSFSCHATLTPEDMRSLAWPGRPMPLPSTSPSASALDYLEARGIITAKDAHLLVASPSDRRNTRGITCHCTGAPLPRGSLFPIISHGRIIDGAFVCSPELALAQMSSQLDSLTLLRLCLEACGTYRLIDCDAHYGCEPLTSCSLLGRYAKSAQGLKGHVPLGTAARLCADNCGSPAEAAIYLALSLPLAKGGYELPKPELNPTLDLSRESATVLGHGSITPDGLWKPARGASSRRLGRGAHPYEYDSKQYHSEMQRAEIDQRRRNAYVTLGMSVTVFYPEHLKNPYLFDALVGGIRKCTGFRTYHLPDDYHTKRLKLMTALFHSWRKGEAL